MPLPDSNLSSLDKIRIKVRRLVRGISEQQIADQTIDDYVNTFVLYDFPEQLRLFNLRTDLSFYCDPFIATYDTTKITTTTDPLYNFLNIYTTIHPPVYIAGYQSYYSQSPEQFFGIYPKLENIFLLGIGDGIQTTYTGTLPNTFPNIPPPPNLKQFTPILQNEVLFSSIDTNYNGLKLIDVPEPALGAAQGFLTVPNTDVPAGTINYITGAYDFTFPNPPGLGQKVNAQVVQYQPARPNSLLFYDGVFTLRPIPDQPYKINFEVYKRPDALLAAGDVPGLSEWWQYIAYGAAKKVFEDRMDLESVAMIMPEFKQQERLILRRTLIQNSNLRTKTIYSDNANGYFGSGFGYGGSGFGPY